LDQNGRSQSQIVLNAYSFFPAGVVCWFVPYLSKNYLTVFISLVGREMGKYSYWEEKSHPAS
jgi:hypothetical protein